MAESVDNNNGEPTRYEKWEKAVDEKRTCAECHWHFPRAAPVSLSYSMASPSILAKSEAPKGKLNLCLCSNPESTYHMIIRGVAGTCDEFEVAPTTQTVKVPDKVAEKLKGKDDASRTDKNVS